MESRSERYGIQNAEARYAAHAEGRLTSAQLLKKSAHTDDSKEPSDEALVRRKKQEEAIREELEEVLEAEKGEFTGEDTQLLVKNPPKLDPFPIFIVMVAVFKDFLDIPANLSIVGVVVSVSFSFVLSIILFLWLLGKMSGGWWKKRLLRRLWRRYIFTILVEFLPLFQLVPATTLFVIMAHYRETKTVKRINAALEKMRGMGIK